MLLCIDMKEKHIATDIVTTDTVHVCFSRIYGFLSRMECHILYQCNHFVLPNEINTISY